MFIFPNKEIPLYGHTLQREGGDTRLSSVSEALKETVGDFNAIACIWCSLSSRHDRTFNVPYVPRWNVYTCSSLLRTSILSDSIGVRLGACVLGIEGLHHRVLRYQHCLLSPQLTFKYLRTKIHHG